MIGLGFKVLMVNGVEILEYFGSGICIGLVFCGKKF